MEFLQNKARACVRNYKYSVGWVKHWFVYECILLAFCLLHITFWSALNGFLFLPCAQGCPNLGTQLKKFVCYAYEANGEILWRLSYWCPRLPRFAYTSKKIFVGYAYEDNEPRNKLLTCSGEFLIHVWGCPSLGTQLKNFCVLCLWSQWT